MVARSRWQPRVRLYDGRRNFELYRRIGGNGVEQLE